jgi:hypothetical protein
MVIPAAVQIALGALVAFMGRRLAILAAAAGFLIGFNIVTQLFAPVDVLLAVIIGGGAGIAAVVVVSVAKRLAQMIAGVVGALAGGGISLWALDMLNLSLGLGNWLVLVIGGIVGFVLMTRFFNFGLVVLSSFVGASLVSRGAQDLLQLNDTVTLIIGIAVVIVAMLYQFRAAKR